MFLRIQLTKGASLVPDPVHGWPLRLGDDPTARHQVGPGRPLMVWRKRKWFCTNEGCEKKTLTEATPVVPSRARITQRAKAEMAHAVLDDDRSVLAVAAADGCTWNTCHVAVATTADAALGRPFRHRTGRHRRRRGPAGADQRPLGQTRGQLARRA